MAGLNAKQQRFVGEYMIDLNASQAAIRAGYSQKTAGAVGHELLKKPEIAEAVAAMQQERARRMNISADRVLQELSRIAFFDPRKLLNENGTPKQMAELDDDTAAALAGMDVSEIYDGVGASRVTIGTTKKVKVADKVAALGLAMRHLGMLTDKIEVRDVTPRADRLREARARRMPK